MPPLIDRITLELRQHAVRLRAELDRVDAALAALAPLSVEPPDYEQLTAEHEQHEAPFGYKADGTPRRRRAASVEQLERMADTRRRKQERLKAAQRPLKLKVLSSTHPTEAELKDRRLVHATEQPA